MKLRSKVFAGLAAAMMLLTCGCAGGSSSTAGASTDGQASENISVTESENMNETKTYNLTSENVKLIGRTAENNGTLWLALSASGVEFTFTGTKLTLNIAGDNNVSAGKDKQARLSLCLTRKASTACSASLWKKAVWAFRSSPSVFQRLLISILKKIILW